MKKHTSSASKVGKRTSIERAYRIDKLSEYEKSRNSAHQILKFKRYTFGLIAEYIVFFIYKIQFYKILHHRKRYYTGEIDLIAIRGKNLIFIEVKGRSTNLDDKFITWNQQKRIKRSAEVFLYHNPHYVSYNIRFDLVIVQPYKFPVIIRNAW